MTVSPDYEISSLAEGVKAVLIGPDGETLGYWRYGGQAGSGARRPKTFYDLSSPVPRVIHPAKWPTHCRLLSPAAYGEPPALLEATPPDLGLAFREAKADTEARVLAAFRTYDALPDRERAKLRVRSCWPDVPTGRWDYHEAVVRHSPTAAAIADADIVMGWIVEAGLGHPAQRERLAVLRWRAQGRSYKSIGERGKPKRNGESVKDAYKRDIETLHAIAHGEAPRRRTRRPRPRCDPDD